MKSWIGNLTLYFIYTLFVSTIGGLLFGYHLAELNAPQDVITCKKKSISLSLSLFTTAKATRLPQCIPMTSLEFGLVSSSFTVGGLVGALLAGTVAARYGRLKTMRYTTFFFMAGPLAEALAPNVPVFVIGRFLSGLGAGAAVVVVPIYISETAPPAQKGFFGAFTQISTNLGILITQGLGYFLSRGKLWRVILAVGGGFGLLQLLGLSLSVESPKYLADHGAPGEAKKVLRRLRGHGSDISDEVAAWGVESSRDEHEEENALLREATNSSLDSSSTDKPSTISILQALTHPRHNRATFVVMGVMLAQQFCGINSIIMYGVSLLSTLLGTSSSLLNIFLSLLNLLITLLCAPLPDRLGRRPCLLLSTSAMGLSSLALALSITHDAPRLAAASVAGFVAGFALGLGPVPFILASELAGKEAVGATQSWALAANWGATFVVAQFFPVLNERLGRGRVFFVFAGLAALFVVGIAWAVPETRGRRDADEVWGREARGRRED